MACRVARHFCLRSNLQLDDDLALFGLLAVQMHHGCVGILGEHDVAVTGRNVEILAIACVHAAILVGVVGHGDGEGIGGRR